MLEARKVPEFMRVQEQLIKDRIGEKLKDY
jgi:hypothetical protein